MNTRKLWPAVLSGAALFAIASVAAQAAQPDAQSDRAIHVAEAEAGVSDGTVEKFADAFTEVQRVREDLTVRLQEVNDEEKANQLVQEAREEMVSAVEDKGLSVDEYNNVAAQMETNPQLRERVTAALEQRSAN